MNDIIREQRTKYLSTRAIPDTSLTTWLAAAVASLHDQQGGSLETYLRSFAIIQHLIDQIKLSPQFSEQQQAMLCMIHTELERIAKETAEP